jgi:hypothetical protein
VTALAYVSAIDQPKRFSKSTDVGPYLGLGPRRYQSGEVDFAGRIFKCGARMVRSLLFEAGGVLLFRSKQPSALKDWGTRLVCRVGSGKARVALGRKLAVLLHRLWIQQDTFRKSPAVSRSDRAVARLACGLQRDPFTPRARDALPTRISGGQCHDWPWYTGVVNTGTNSTSRSCPL